MKITRPLQFIFVSGLAFVSPLVALCRAGQELKWENVPEAVRATVLANGGTAGRTVDLETGKKNGLSVYEAGIQDKDGSDADLVITGDGKLVDTKHDDASDRAGELADAAKGKIKFSHPRDITNRYLPLARLKQDVLEGTEDGAKIRVERTVFPDTPKTFPIAGQPVEALAVEDREFKGGPLEEVTLDYFAQDDEGNVYYLGEDVDEYENGKVTGHGGGWLLGKDTQTPGIIIPGHPKIGDKFKSEDVSKEISEADEILSVSETVTVGAGTFTNCIKTKESPSDGTTEYKYYAPGVGVVREIPANGDEQLMSHTTR